LNFNYSLLRVKSSGSGCPLSLARHAAEGFFPILGTPPSPPSVSPSKSFLNVSLLFSVLLSREQLLIFLKIPPLCPAPFVRRLRYSLPRRLPVPPAFFSSCVRELMLFRFFLRSSRLVYLGVQSPTWFFPKASSPLPSLSPKDIRPIFIDSSTPQLLCFPPPPPKAPLVPLRGLFQPSPAPPFLGRSQCTGDDFLRVFVFETHFNVSSTPPPPPDDLSLPDSELCNFFFGSPHPPHLQGNFDP